MAHFISTVCHEAVFCLRLSKKRRPRRRKGVKTVLLLRALAPSWPDKSKVEYRKLLREQLLRSRSAVADEDGRYQTQREQRGCKTPSELFDEVGRFGSAEHLIGLRAAECSIHTASLGVLYQNRDHQQYADESDQDGQSS